jgi:hypothetical protein
MSSWVCAVLFGARFEIKFRSAVNTLSTNTVSLDLIVADRDLYLTRLFK